MISDPIRPFLSIGLTTFNRHDLVTKSVQSLIDQSYDNYEIIVVDDSPSNPVPDHIVKNWQGCGLVRYYLHSVNLGLSAARNTAIFHARGEYFSFCDDDDMWPSDFASRMIEALSCHSPVPKVVLAYDHFWLPYKGLLASLNTLNDFILFGFTPPVGSQMYELKLVRSCSGYHEDVKSGVDHDLWISLSQYNPFVGLCWGPTPIINSSVSISRITNSENSRRKGITNSLEIWKPIIIKVFGVEFYSHFVKSYHDYLNYSFFVHAIYSRSYISCFLRLAKSPVILQKLFYQLFMKLTGRKRYPLFSRFNPRL